jgi:hypothetical protein
VRGRLEARFFRAGISCNGCLRAVEVVFIDCFGLGKRCASSCTCSKEQAHRRKSICRCVQHQGWEMTRFEGKDPLKKNVFVGEGEDLGLHCY